MRGCTEIRYYPGNIANQARFKWIRVVIVSEIHGYLQIHWFWQSIEIRAADTSNVFDFNFN